MSSAIKLSNSSYFESLNGLWTGKKTPLVPAAVIRNTNFTAAGDVDYSDVALLEVEPAQLAKRELKQGDIIVERSGGGPKQPVGRVVFFDRRDEGFSFSNFTSVIRVRDRAAFEPRFVFFRLLELYLGGQTEDLQRFTTGIRNLDFGAYKDRASVPSWPLTEQRAIVQLLDLARSAVRSQDRLLTTARQLKAALLDRAMTEGLRAEALVDSAVGRIPASWNVRSIGSIARLSSGGTPSRSEPDFWDGGSIPWVKTGEINNGVITSTSECITAAGVKGSSAKLFPAGTLLMAMYGQGVTRGKVAILGIEATTNQACVAFFPTPEVSAEYLFYLFQARYDAIRQYGHGANQKNLSAEIIKGIQVAVPADIGEQERAVELLKAMDCRIAAADRLRLLNEDMFTALLHTVWDKREKFPPGLVAELEALTLGAEAQDA